MTATSFRRHTLALTACLALALPATAFGDAGREGPRPDAAPAPTSAPGGDAGNERGNGPKLGKDQRHAPRICRRAARPGQRRFSDTQVAAIAAACAQLDADLAQARTDFDAVMTQARTDMDAARTQVKQACQAARDAGTPEACGQAMRRAMAPIKAQVKAARRALRDAVKAAQERFRAAIKAVRDETSSTDEPAVEQDRPADPAPAPAA